MFVAYHSIVDPASVDDAEIVTTPGPQFDPSVPVGAVGRAFTVAITATRVADKQPVVVLRLSA